MPSSDTKMATAISKPTSHPPKMKRPPPPFQPGVNGVKSQQPSASPQSASKRIPGSNSQSAAAGSTGGPVTNGSLDSANGAPAKGALNRSKKDAQKLADQSTRSQKTLARNMSIENDRHLGKSSPEPYGELPLAAVCPSYFRVCADYLSVPVRTTSYILKKFAKSPPSLTVHLHPTHFRFEQQDGSFPYNSEMKVIIEHIRAGTVPHDMMEELLRGNVRFYEGELLHLTVSFLLWNLTCLTGLCLGIRLSHRSRRRSQVRVSTDQEIDRSIVKRKQHPLLDTQLQ